MEDERLLVMFFREGEARSVIHVDTGSCRLLWVGGEDREHRAHYRQQE